MIPINDVSLYEAALASLKSAVGSGYLGRPAQIWLGAKHYGKAIPHIGDPGGIPTGDLEEMLDDLFMKPGRSQPEKVLIIFDNAYKVPSGQTAGGLSGPSNIWRNNLNLQKGYMCFSSAQELLNPAFRNPSRVHCPHLAPVNPGMLQGAECTLHPGTRYRGEDHLKMMQKDPNTGEYWIYNPYDYGFYSNILLPNSGNKIPVVALIIALYHGGKLAAGRTSVTVDDFITDFDISITEFATYFEDDPKSVAHLALVHAHPGLKWARTSNAILPPLVPPALPGLPPVPVPIAGKTKPKKVIPSVSGSFTSPPPPAGGQWWNAELAVRSLLEQDGWQVDDLTRYGLGFDLKATKAGTVRLVEVKSSVSTCAPSLTDREYHEARQSRAAYVLAIVENFDPKCPAIVQWVQDPARLKLTARQVRQFYLPRSIWKNNVSNTFP